MILVGSTVAAWKCDGSETDWLRHAEAMREASPVELRFFCAVQTNDEEFVRWHREDSEPYDRLEVRLEDLGGTCTRFRVGIWRLSTRERLIGITTGRNLVREYALRDTDATHVLFLDTDVAPDPECIRKLLEVNHPVVGGDVPKYCLSGPEVDSFDRAHDVGRCHVRPGTTQVDCDCGQAAIPLQEHWNTAGFLLVRRDVLRQVAWRWEGDTMITDDPCFALDAERAGFGKTWVRKDCIGEHVPLVPVEKR